MSLLLRKVPPSLTSPIGIATGTICIPLVWWTYRAIRYLVAPFFSPLRVIRGPPSKSFILGHVEDLVGGNNYKPLRAYSDEYGQVYLVRAVLGELKCVLTDHRAVAHLLSNHMTYYKPESLRFQLSYILGQGLLSTEGLEHRYLRRVMMPAFSSSHLRNILPIFLSKSEEVRDILREQIASSETPQVIDMADWLSRTTLDIIGLAGFKYEFNNLRGGQHGSELSVDFHRMNYDSQNPVFFLLKAFMPPLRFFEFDALARSARTLRRTMRRIGLQLIQDKQKEMLEEANVSGDGTVLEKKVQERDLLSLMIKSSMSTTTPDDQKMSVPQILDQIPTFLIAGHETTSTATAWGLFALAQRPAMQSRLRQELLEAFPDEDGEVTIESLNALPYLEAVVRETLRYHSPVGWIEREAEEDDVIPLDHEFIGRDGKSRKQIRVKKGDNFIIPTGIMNRSQDVWGPDADEFNPDRWLVEMPAAVSKIPGVWANLMTFIGGQRSCIGFKFAVLEMKVLLLQLIRSFEFELAVDPADIIDVELIVSRPFVKYELEKGSQLPMIVRPVRQT